MHLVFFAGVLSGTGLGLALALYLPWLRVK